MPASPDVLRTRLKALVEEWRALALLYTPRHMTYRLCMVHASELAALLAESEPERNKLPFLCSCHSGSVCGEACRRGEHHSGCSWLGWRSAPSPDCEAKAKLPLGHEFVPCESTTCKGCHYLLRHTIEGMADSRCGQPRSAHEPRRGR